MFFHIFNAPQNSGSTSKKNILSQNKAKVRRQILQRTSGQGKVIEDKDSPPKVVETGLPDQTNFNQVAEDEDDEDDPI